MALQPGWWASWSSRVELCVNTTQSKTSRSPTKLQRRCALVVKNMAPCLGTLNNRCRIIIGTQKGTLILTITHLFILVPSGLRGCDRVHEASENHLHSQGSAGGFYKRSKTQPSEVVSSNQHHKQLTKNTTPHTPDKQLLSAPSKHEFESYGL